MIIKKKKNNDNNDDRSQRNTDLQKQTSGIFDILSEATERQERRRGDRRRGYRRIEDRSLVSRAHEEAKIIKEQAAHDGFQNGLTKADGEITHLQEAINSLMSVKEAAYEYYKKDIIEVALMVAKKILSAQVRLEPELIVEIASNVIKEISEEESKVTFIINPADEFVLSEALEKNSVFKSKRATMLIQTSEEIERGSCKVITNSGQIDATFTSQLNIIKKAFEEGIV